MAEENLKCEICGATDDLVKHHVSYDPEVIQVLCRGCHRKVHGKFEVRIQVLLPEELAEFLEDMVQKGVAESLSQALRKCVAVAKTYMPEVNVEIKPKEK